jgi:polysaccharide pyruvyl transferase CsaB
MRKIIICGNYGATNLGDEAILAGILELFRRLDPERLTNVAKIIILSTNPNNTTALHGVESLPLVPAGLRSLIRALFKGSIIKTLNAIRNCDGFILGGGGLFNDEKPLSILIWGLQAHVALLFRKPLMCLGQSVGPLNNFFSRQIVKSIYARCRVVTVRDINSQKLLRSLNLPVPKVVADPAFLLHMSEPASAKREQIVVLSVRSWHKNMPSKADKIFAQFIETNYSKYGLRTVIVPFSLYPENDSILLDKIFAQIKDKAAAEVFEFSNDFTKVLALIKKATVVVGMRLHSLIFATLTATPFLALSYSDKVSSYARELEMDDYALPLTALSEKTLSEKFNLLMSNYERVKGHIIEKNLLNRASAAKNIDEIKLFIDSL